VIEGTATTSDGSADIYSAGLVMLHFVRTAPVAVGARFADWCCCTQLRHLLPESVRTASLLELLATPLPDQLAAACRLTGLLLTEAPGARPAAEDALQHVFVAPLSAHAALAVAAESEAIVSSSVPEERGSKRPLAHTTERPLRPRTCPAMVETITSQHG
jgi:hypothetical protein